LTNYKIDAYLNSGAGKIMGQNYFVIIGDMVQSRNLNDRQKVQEAFGSALKNAQKTYGQGIVSPLTLTIGDEFQAVLDRAQDFFAIINHLEESLPDIRFRYGLGVGEISTALNRKAAIGMDGPAFHFARQALEQARQMKRRFVFVCASPKIQARIDLFFNWIDTITAGWSKEKLQILHLSQLRLKQKEVAAKIGISQPAVSQHMRQPVFRLVLQTQQVVLDEIDDLLRSAK